MATDDKRIDELPAVTELDGNSLMILQQNAAAMKMTVQQLLTFLNKNVDAGSAVLFVAQNLTEAQKAQARTNIGAAAPGEGGGGTAEGAVLYTAQALTEEQQHQARLNIRCGSVGDSLGCTASGSYSNAEGYYTKATGYYSHAEGQGAKAAGDLSHAEGYYTKATGRVSHAEGYYTKATGEESHAEGDNTEAVGDDSHAEGYYTKATGYVSHVEGGYSVASAYYAHAEGYSTEAAGQASHAEGCLTKASRAYQHVEGAYNVVEDVGSSSSAKGKYIHIVGNGTADDARSNAHTLDWNGVPWFAGNRVMLGGTGMDDTEAVALMPVFVPQTLTEAQKSQARANIGAAAIGEGGSSGVGITTITIEEVN